MFSTDNGTEVFTWPDGGQTPFAQSKGTVMEGGFRAPAMIRWPGRVPAGKVENGIISGLDWFPTFVAAAGNPNIAEVLTKGKLWHRLLGLLGRCGIGSWGVRCLSLADYVRGTGPTDGATAPPEGASVGYPRPPTPDRHAPRSRGQTRRGRAVRRARSTAAYPFWIRARRAVRSAASSSPIRRASTVATMICPISVCTSLKIPSALSFCVWRALSSVGVT